MKTCCICGLDKPYEDFYRATARKDGRQTHCAECSKKERIRRQKIQDGTWFVYHIPYDNYVGITSRLSKRLYRHKTELKRPIDGYSIVCEFDNVYDAIILEAKLHKLGFKGCQYVKDK